MSLGRNIKENDNVFRIPDTVLYSPSAIPDVNALRKCWHPVAYSEEIQDQPYSSRLLNEQIVLWRNKENSIQAVADLCIHRGTALSIGKVVDGEIMCPYHGWRFRGDGACTMIPQRENPRHIPDKARVTAYQAQERYGIVWVALDTPLWNIPDIPEFDEPEFHVISTGPYDWQSDASRQLENFTDFGHFPWVHTGLLGDPERVIVPKYQVETDEHVMRYHFMRPEAPQAGKASVWGREKKDVLPVRHSYYELHLPYTIVLRQDWGGADKMVHLFVSQPIGKDKSRAFLRTARNYAHDQDPRVLQEFTDIVLDQDQTIVESQRPEFVPFDLADELHLDFDLVAINYRKLMRATGLALKVGTPPRIQ